MKTIIPKSPGTLTWLAVTAGALLAGLAIAEPTPQIETRKVVVTSDGAGKTDEELSRGVPGSNRKIIKIESIERNRGKEPPREVTWLGVSTEETNEALASQLGLKSGQGLVVVYVAPDSPAAKAGIQKHDVLVELGEQLLVDPAQLRKLVQMQKEGDTIKLTLHRGGKKQTVSATLAKRTEASLMKMEERAFDGDTPKFRFEFGDAKIGERVGETLRSLNGSLARAGIDKQIVNVEVQRNMEVVRKAIHDALRQSAHVNRSLDASDKDLEEQARAKVAIENDATVTVKQDGVVVKSIVRSDDAGTFVIVANPKKHLTVHDKDGKLLFDGGIESQEDQRKVPAGLWEKVEPMLQQIKPAEDGEPEPHAQSEDGPKI